MIGKEIKGEKPATLAEVRSILAKLKKEQELTYEQKASFEYANEFGKISPKKLSEALEQLRELGADEKTAMKIVDVRPKTKEEVKLIFEKLHFDLTDDKIKKIMSITAGLK